MKLPAIMFYTGDWKKDPALSLCSPATRGIWTDAVCAMHELRTGTLAGTPEELSRVLRCSAAEVSAAARELQATGTADVMERNGVVTLTCRRLTREAKERASNRLRVTRHRQRGPCNEVVTRNPPPCNGASSYSVPEAAPPTNRRDDWPELKTVLAWADMIACPKDEAERFWNHFESSGWIDKNGHPIQNARAKLANWWADARARPLEAAFKAHRPGPPLTDPVKKAARTADRLHDKEKLL